MNIKKSIEQLIKNDENYNNCVIDYILIQDDNIYAIASDYDVFITKETEKDNDEQELGRAGAGISERGCGKHAEQVEKGTQIADQNACVRFGVFCAINVRTILMSCILEV